MSSSSFFLVLDQGWQRRSLTGLMNRSGEIGGSKRLEMSRERQKRGARQAGRRPKEGEGEGASEEGDVVDAEVGKVLVEAGCGIGGDSGREEERSRISDQSRRGLERERQTDSERRERKRRKAGVAIGAQPPGASEEGRRRRWTGG